MKLPSLEPESSASANSAIPAYVDSVIITHSFRFVKVYGTKTFLSVSFLPAQCVRP